MLLNGCTSLVADPDAMPSCPPFKSKKQTHTLPGSTWGLPTENNEQISIFVEITRYIWSRVQLNAQTMCGKKHWIQYIWMTMESAFAGCCRHRVLCPMFDLGHNQCIYIIWIKCKSSCFICLRKSPWIWGVKACAQKQHPSVGGVCVGGSSLLRNLELKAWSFFISASSALKKKKLQQMPPEGKGASSLYLWYNSRKWGSLALILA